GLRQVAGGDEGIVACADDDDVRAQVRFRHVLVSKGSGGEADALVGPGSRVANRRSLAWRPGGDDTTAGGETDVLGPHELVQGLGRVLSSEAAAFHSAEGRADEGTSGVVVDEHHADLEAPGEFGRPD